MTTLDWLRLIRTARNILRQAADMLDLPDIDDPQAVYAWTHTILVIADQASKVTPTAVDDRIISWFLDGPLASYENFLPLYKVFREILSLLNTADDNATVAAKVALIPEAQALQDNPEGLPPAQLILLIVRILRLVLDLAR